MATRKRFDREKAMRFPILIVIALLPASALAQINGPGIGQGGADATYGGGTAYNDGHAPVPAYGAPPINYQTPSMPGVIRQAPPPDLGGNYGYSSRATPPAAHGCRNCDSRAGRPHPVAPEPKSPLEALGTP